MARNLFPNHQFRNDIFHLQIGTRKKVLNHPFGYIMFHSRTEFGTKRCWMSSNCEKTVPFSYGNSEQNSTKFGPKWPVWEQSLPFTDRNAEQKTVLNYQFGNNVIHLQIGTRNKVILIYQFGNKLFHLQIGTRNKKVLNDQYGNNVFHLQIGTRNKKVLNDQFGNNLFHLQIGNRNKAILNNQFGNEMCSMQN